MSNKTTNYPKYVFYNRYPTLCPNEWKKYDVKEVRGTMLLGKSGFDERWFDAKQSDWVRIGYYTESELENLRNATSRWEKFTNWIKEIWNA